MNAEEMQFKMPEPSTTGLIPPPLSLQGTFLQDIFLLLRKLAVYWGVWNKEATWRVNPLWGGACLSIDLPVLEILKKTKKTQLHSSVGEQDSSVNWTPRKKEDPAHFILWGPHFVVCVWNPVLRVLIHHGWLWTHQVTAGWQQKTNPKLAPTWWSGWQRQSPGMFCQKPGQGKTEFPQPPFPSIFL